MSIFLYVWLMLDAWHCDVTKRQMRTKSGESVSVCEMWTFEHSVWAKLLQMQIKLTSSLQNASMCFCAGKLFHFRQLQILSTCFVCFDYTDLCLHCAAFHRSPVTSPNTLSASLCVFHTAVPNEYASSYTWGHFGNTATLHTWTCNLYNLPLAKHSESRCKPRGQVFH